MARYSKRKPDTVKMIMSNQLPEGVSYNGNSGYGLAGAVDLESGEYSWGGAASTNFWIDPVNEMIIITYAQLMPSDHGYAYLFKDLVNRALVEEQPDGIRSSRIENID